jgi:hypothetical protein
VSKRKDSPYRSGRSPHWLKFKNPAARAVKREAEEDWGQVTRETQKDAERPVLERILAALALTPDSEPEMGEAPDFVIQLRGQSVGVEMTSYRSEDNIDGRVKRRAAESEWELLKAAAQKFWSQYDDLRAVNVGVMFKERVPRRGDHHAFIEEVAAVVRQHLGQLRPEKQNFFPSASFPLMYRHLDRLVLRTGPYAEWYSNLSFGYLARPNESNISDIVAAKSKKQFRPTDELWLVIHCGTRMSEMTLELDGVEDFRSIHGLGRSKFARVFVLTHIGIYEWSRTTDDWRQL